MIERQNVLIAANQRVMSNDSIANQVWVSPLDMSNCMGKVIIKVTEGHWDKHPRILLPVKT